MSKYDFLEELNSRLELAGVSSASEVVSFYDEAISDRIDAGIDEEEAVAQVGSIDEIVRNVRLDRPVAQVVSGRIKESHRTAKNNGRGWLWVVLAIIGFPIWLPLVIAAATVVFSLYIAMWSLVFALFVTVLALGFAGIICIFASAIKFTGIITTPAALGVLGTGLILVAIALFLWRPVIRAGKGLIKLIGLMLLGIKKIFV